MLVLILTFSHRLKLAFLFCLTMAVPLHSQDATHLPLSTNCLLNCLESVEVCSMDALRLFLPMTRLSAQSTRSAPVGGLIDDDLKIVTEIMPVPAGVKPGAGSFVVNES